MTRPTGVCPDCGEAITLHLSGWWTHDGMPGECWHQSMDGPGDLPMEESQTGVYVWPADHLAAGAIS